MDYRFEDMSTDHANAAIDILNYYVDHGFAAFSEVHLPYSLFEVFLEASRGYPALAVTSEAGETVGFAWLQAYHPSPAFRRTAEIGYFLRRDFTRRGIGKAILDRFIAASREMGIDSILASISSLNAPSLRFHLQNGFVECGRFAQVGRKFSQDFDLVWLQKRI